MLPTRFRSLALTALATCSLALPAQAEVLFRGDMETGDLEQWSYLLKEEGLSVVTDQVAQGKYAAKITISDKELWEGNNLNRVEVQHKPDNAYLTEGKEIYYGFSFYLPEKLADSDHQILYWETTENYQQVMQVAVKGEHIHFATQDPFKIQWEADGKVTAGKWHRLVIHVKWSASPETGQVDLWFNGEQVVKALKAKTFFGNPAFVQHGMLRQPTIAKVETLYFDDARSGTTLEDVLMPDGMPSGTGGGGAGGQTMGGAAGAAGAAGSGAGSNAGGSAGTASGGSPTAGSGGAPSGGGMAAGGTPSAGAPTTSAGTATTPTTPSDDSGCSFSRRPTSGAATLAALLGLIALRRRRR